MKDPLEGLPELGDVNEFAAGLDKAQQFAIYGRHWCPNCKRENRFSTAVSRATINLKFASAVPRAKSIGSGYDGSWENIADKIDRFQGSQFSITCTNCHQSGRTLIQKIAGQISALVFFDQSNSIATANTPDAVRYYLEQAQACNSVKAFSATLAMYRTALDAILFGEGYHEGMVGKKITELESDIKNSKAPVWTKDLSTEYLKVIKDLGNSSLHISADDITSEKSIDTADIKEVELALDRMLFVIFEKAKQEEANLNRLKEFSDRKKGR